MFDEDLLGSDLIGCWAMTAKWFFMNPKYNWHTSLEVETDPSCNSVMIKGWFPLAAQGHKKRGSRGEINMSLRWWYDSERISVQRKPLTALEQLTMNSDESKLRLGDVDAVINMIVMLQEGAGNCDYVFLLTLRERSSFCGTSRFLSR